MAVAGISTLKMKVGYAAEATAGTRPTANYTMLERCVSVGALSITNENLDATALEDEIKRYVAGIGDTGGSTTLTFNLTSGTTTEIEAMISAYNTAKEANKEMWFEVWSPYLTKAFFFKGEPPQKIGMPEIGVNTVLQVEVPITVSDYHGLDTAVEPTI